MDKRSKKLIQALAAAGIMITGSGLGNLLADNVGAANKITIQASELAKMKNEVPKVLAKAKDDRFLRDEVRLDRIFPCPEILAAVSEDLGVGPASGITQQELDRVIHLSVREASDFEGLQFLRNLEAIHFRNVIHHELHLDGFDELKSLEVIGGNLQEIRLTNLSRLVLAEVSGNQLSGVFLENLPLLQTLDFSSNFLTRLELPPLGGLRSLNLNHNQLRRLDIHGQDSLSNINLGYNQLLTASFKELPKLAHLNLTRNRLYDLELEQLPSLTNLYLGVNQLTDLDFLKSLPKLNILNLYLNFVSDLSPAASASHIMAADQNIYLGQVEVGTKFPLNLFNAKNQVPELAYVSGGVLIAYDRDEGVFAIGVTPGEKTITFEDDAFFGTLTFEITEATAGEVAA